MTRRHTRPTKLVVSLGKICEGLLHLRKKRSKSLVEWGKWLKETRLGVGLCEQLNLPQRRRRNHEIDDSKLWQTNHRIIFLDLPFLLFFSSYSCFRFIYCSVLACEVDIVYIYCWLSLELHCKYYCELDYILGWFKFCSCSSVLALEYFVIYYSC
jgi:hypothetical protein